MKHIKSYKIFESESEYNLRYEIEWNLEDISGDCSPSGSTTIDSGFEEFEDLYSQYEIIDRIKDNHSNSVDCKLYMILKTYQNNELINTEDIEPTQLYQGRWI